MELEEDLPTFRPFTREELNTIENRIFENKLAAKKKQETRDKNIAVRKPLLKMNIIPPIDWGIFERVKFILNIFPVS